MITIRKLSGLPPKLLVKKSAYLLHGFSRSVSAEERLDMGYIRDLCSMERLLESVSAETAERLSALPGQLRSADTRRAVFLLDDVYYLLLQEIGADPADWDFTDRFSGAERRILPFTVYIDRVRSPFNVGSIFRTADSFGVGKILLGEGSAPPEHPRARRTARGCTETVAWRSAVPADIASTPDRPVFALELGGRDIGEFLFPAGGTVIVGSEELGVSPETARIARESLGYVTIPLAGTKGSLNVSVAFGILMQHWYSAAGKR